VIREPNIPEDATKVILDVSMEVYLRGRHDPLQCVGSFYFNREHLDEDDLVESFMGIVTSTFRSAIFDRSAPLVVLSDRNGNKFLIETSEMQAVSVLAPSPKTIGEAIEQSEEMG
jgi:hypothetical protein